MKKYNILYLTKNQIAEKKDVRQIKLKKVINKMQNKGEKLIMISNAGEYREEEER